ncbi:MAG: glycerol-3-phosphate dehydrogenase/oxidase, partial [Nitrospirae bacterium]|nr:glycerol-3-phosphate dehydrogenase/oxidase [Nitrospirota bacterium]
ITNPISERYAFGIPVSWEYRDDRTVVKRGKRMLFVAPWQGHSIVGTTYAPFDGKADEFKVTGKDVHELVEMVNQVCPSLRLDLDDVKFVHGGLLPCTHDSQAIEGVQLKTKYEIHDHRADGIEGILSVTGVKYTTARHVAQKVIDYILFRDNQSSPPSQSAQTPLFGGAIECFESFVETETKKNVFGFSRAAFRSLLHNYGTMYPKVLQMLPNNNRPNEPDSCEDADLIKAQVRFAIREEMAQKLTDVVMRRTEIGSAGHPGEKILEVCAGEMSKELGWNHQKLQEELRETQEQFVIAA